MSDDIVKTVRDFVRVFNDLGVTRLLDEAAYEIERLREQVRMLEAERDQWIRQAIGNG